MSHARGALQACDASRVEMRHDADGVIVEVSVLLCRRHHRAVHEEGFQVERRENGELQFRWPNGDVLLEVPPPPKTPHVGWAIDVLHPLARRDPRDAAAHL